MKKYNFVFKKLLEYKKMLLDTERNKLTVMSEERKNLGKQYLSFCCELEGLSVKIFSKMQKGTIAVNIIECEKKKKYIRFHIEYIKNKMDEIDISIAKQQDKVNELFKDVSGLEKLDERKRSEYIYLESHENDKLVDEFISYKTSQSAEDMFYGR